MGGEGRESTLKLSYRGPGLSAPGAEGVSYPKTPQKAVRDGKGTELRLDLSLPPPVKEKYPETSLCGMRGGEEEICERQNPNPAKSSPEKPEEEESRIRQAYDRGSRSSLLVRSPSRHETVSRGALFPSVIGIPSFPCHPAPVSYSPPPPASPEMTWQDSGSVSRRFLPP